MRKAKEPHGTLKPMWNILSDGINLFPHSITVDTQNRKDTVIRKNVVANATEIFEKNQIYQICRIENRGEYDRNREKIQKFYLDEQKEKREQEEKAKNQQRPSHSGKDLVNPTSIPAGKQRQKPR